MSIGIKRAYEAASPGDGHRVLIDRLWPRGVPRSAAAIDEWRRELAPSDALRRWFGHDPARWDEFRERYRKELEAPEAQAALRELASRARRGPVTLVYGARDAEHNNAVVLQQVLVEMGAPVRGGARPARQAARTRAAAASRPPRRPPGRPGGAAR